MKKTLALLAMFFAIAFTSFVFSSCDDKPDDIELDLSLYDIPFSYEGGSATIDVKTNSSSWEAVENEQYDWLTVTKSAESFVVRATGWDGDQQRRATVTVTAPGADARSVNIVQNSKGAEKVTLKVTPGTIYFDALGRTEDATVKVDTNQADWDWVLESLNAEQELETEVIDWITVEPDKTQGALTIIVDEYKKTNSEREAVLRITVSDTATADESVIIIQKPLPVFELSGSKLYFEADGTSTTSSVSVTTSLDWSATADSPVPDWMELHVDKAGGFFAVRVKEYDATDYPRMATITVRADSDMISEKIVTVTQHNKEAEFEDHAITPEDMTGVWRVNAMSYDQMQPVEFEINVYREQRNDDRVIFLGEFIPYEMADYPIVFEIENGSLKLESGWSVGRTYDDQYSVQQSVGYFYENGFRITYYFYPWVAKYNGDDTIYFPVKLMTGISDTEIYLVYYAFSGSGTIGRLTDFYSQITMTRLTADSGKSSVQNNVPYYIKQLAAPSTTFTSVNMY